MQLPYSIIDVFTKKRLQGNPLAVVFDADNVPTNQMQEIAKEFNLSETVFVCSPKNERHVANLRIFTPSEELPFAGHPTVGTAVLLGLKQRITAVRLEEKIGTIVAITERLNKVSGHARFGLPELPKQVGDAPDIDKIAGSLGLQPEQIGWGSMQPTIYSAGVPFVLVPVSDQDALAAIKLERRGWTDVYGGVSDKVYVFTPVDHMRNVQFAARAFIGLGNLKEDPATGSAAAALCGLLAQQYYEGEGLVDFTIAQGMEMGRPSYIEAQIKLENGQLTHAGIGGNAILVGEGTLFLGSE
ncbi:PhzF family phenazine biosynthesis protein [Maritalea porphyrae]|uniref:PhzF family phenazine biosynthesis protein n=1 Tax=Maritalea porphyrae TaxID=880732 RepID=UPI0022AF2DE7|nr:PhzF family phenazine biosynthesis protein [Maritalea porphyrae]MCZ4272640.1 PhzF family phenazine biosynthesis protein [Maritalea porphyrae]